MTKHEPAATFLVGDDQKCSAVCTCGWKSKPAIPQEATLEFLQHVDNPPPPKRPVPGWLFWLGMTPGFLALAMFDPFDPDENIARWVRKRIYARADVMTNWQMHVAKRDA